MWRSRSSLIRWLPSRICSTACGAAHDLRAAGAATCRLECRGTVRRPRSRSPRSRRAPWLHAIDPAVHAWLVESRLPARAVQRVVRSLVLIGHLLDQSVRLETTALKFQAGFAHDDRPQPRSESLRISQRIQPGQCLPERLGGCVLGGGEFSGHSKRGGACRTPVTREELANRAPSPRRASSTSSRSACSPCHGVSVVTRPFVRRIDRWIKKAMRSTAEAGTRDGLEVAY